MNQNSIHYYENTKNAKPHKNIEKFMELNIIPSNALDLGCGAGRDTVFLLKNNWKVLSIDKENTKNYITTQLTHNELKNFDFKQMDFQNLNLKNFNLVVANFSLPFCEKANFNELWTKICFSLNNNGYFVGNFFGENDSWKLVKTNMTFHSKKDVIDLFKDFEIIKFEEIEQDAKTASGNLKHWHIYDIVAKKLNK